MNLQDQDPDHDSPLSGPESFRIIEQMIHTAKKEQKDNGLGWIIWGWLLLSASVLTFLNIRYRWLSNTFIFWNYFGLVSLGCAVFGLVRNWIVRPRRVHTYTADLFRKLNSGFFVFLFVIIVAMNTGVDPRKGFMLLVGLYGFWELIYGAVLNFRPSIIGAYVSWAIAFAGLFTKQMDLVMLLHGLAALCGYVIPGHIAYREFRKAAQPISNARVQRP